MKNKKEFIKYFVCNLAIALICISVFSVVRFGMKNGFSMTKVKAVNMPEFLRNNGIKVKAHTKYRDDTPQLSTYTLYGEAGKYNFELSCMEVDKDFFDNNLFVRFDNYTVYSEKECMIVLNRKGLFSAKKDWEINTFYFDEASGLGISDAQLKALKYLANGGEIYGTTNLLFGDYGDYYFVPLSWVERSMDVANGAKSIKCLGEEIDTSELMTIDEFKKYYEGKEVEKKK